MGEFFNGLSGYESVFWVLALIGSVAFVIIMIMTFIGMDGDADMDADGTDFEADDGGVGFQFFTLKNMVAFFTIFGWTGLVCIDNGFSNILSLVIATIAGLIMMFLTSLLFFWMNKLVQSGTLNVKNAIGEIGEVYLPIGANRSSLGKIQIKVQGSLRELEAITDSKVVLATGSLVKVTGVISSETLLVEQLN
ncbi:MAG: hypothetical protein AB8B53_02285 [Flavobacteriales bacterium]